MPDQRREMIFRRSLEAFRRRKMARDSWGTVYRHREMAGGDRKISHRHREMVFRCRETAEACR